VYTENTWKTTQISSNVVFNFYFFQIDFMYLPTFKYVFKSFGRIGWWDLSVGKLSSYRSCSKASYVSPMLLMKLRLILRGTKGVSKIFFTSIILLMCQVYFVNVPSGRESRFTNTKVELGIRFLEEAAHIRSRKHSKNICKWKLLTWFYIHVHTYFRF